MWFGDADSRLTFFKKVLEDPKLGFPAPVPGVYGHPTFVITMHKFAPAWVIRMDSTFRERPLSVLDHGPTWGRGWRKRPLFVLDGGQSWWRERPFFVLDHVPSWGRVVGFVALR